MRSEAYEENPITHPSEDYVLGTLLTFGEGIELCDKLDSRHFGCRAHQTVWKAIRDQFDAGEAYTADLVYSRLFREDGLAACGGTEAFLELACGGVSPATLHVHARTLEDLRLVRAVETTANTIAERAGERDAEAGPLIENAEREFLQLQQQRETRTECTAKAIMVGVMKTLEARKRGEGPGGISTGIMGLDTAIGGGLFDSNLIILAARPGMGKTTLALNIAANVTTRTQKAAAFFSLEMSAPELGARMVVSASGVNGVPQNEADTVKIGRAVMELSGGKLTVVDSSLLTVGELRAHSRKLKSQGKCDLVIVDYLQLMTGDAESREREIGEISRGLKLLAKELSIPVIALAQLNRNTENRTEKRPTLADLRDSGSIEQDADQVWFIYRDEVYEKATQDKNIAEVIIGKNRHGPAGMVKLRFDGARGRFTDLSW